ncbi:hypothetical protein H8D30_04935 [bacterium]|nr:hypothetical protein [bacterium]
MEPTDLRSSLSEALKDRSLEHLSLSLDEERLDLTRVANNGVTQHTSRHDRTLVATAWDGQKVGAASTTDLSTGGIKATILRAEDAARLAPENPETLPPMDGVGVVEGEAWDEATAHMTAQERVAIIAPSAQAAGKAGRTLAGTVSSGWEATTLVTSQGANLFHRGSRGGVSGTLTDPSGGSYRVSSESTWNLFQLNPKKLLHSLEQQIAPGSSTPQEPGEHRVLLSAGAVGSLVVWCLAMGEARGTDEGRSPFSENGFPLREDGRLLSKGVSLWTDPSHSALRTAPFDEEGHPLQKRVWVEDGYLKSLPCDRYWATQTERQSTGSSWNLGLTVQGEGSSDEELLNKVEEGMFIPRFWYIRTVEPMTMGLTGLTRDGLRQVKGGALGARLQNLRFNDSPLRILGTIVAAGKPQLVSHWGVRMWVPPLVVDGFRTTSTAPGE